jgi:hypothetical protein
MTAKVSLHPYYKITKQVNNANIQFNEARTWTNDAEGDYLFAKYRDWEAVFKWSPALFGEDMRFIMEWGALEWNYATKHFDKDELFIAAAYENYLQDCARKEAAEKSLKKD